MFEVALSCFQRSFELSGRTALLYNIGIAAQRLGRVDQALAAFERFVREAPDDPERGDVEAFIEVLRDVRPRATTTPSASSAAPRTSRAARSPERRTRAEGRSPAAGSPARATAPREGARVRRAERAVGSSEPASARPRSASPWPWVTSAAGVLVAASGVVMIVAASSDAAVVHDASDGTRWADVSDRADRAPGLFLAGQVVLGVGVAAIGAGLGWWILGSRDDESTAARVRLDPTGLRGTF